MFPGRMLLTDGLVHERFDKDQDSFEEDKVDCGIILDVVVRQRPATLDHLACEEQSLLVWMYSFLVLDLTLDKVDSIGCLNVVQGDDLACGHLHKDKHGKELFGLGGLGPVAAHNCVG